MASYAPCPNCKKVTVEFVFSAPKCSNCGKTWATYRSWRENVRLVGGKPVPEGPPGAEPTDEYITSGQLQQDIEEVMERAALEARFTVVKEIGGKAAKIVTDGMADGVKHDIMINDLLQLMVDELKASMRAIGKEPADG